MDTGTLDWLQRLDCAGHHKMLESEAMASVETTSRLACIALLLAGCGRLHRELSDDEWCKSSFDYRPGSREYADCRARIDRQRHRGGEAVGR